MALNAANLANEITALFPGDWNWGSGEKNRDFLDALCSGFVSMWAAGTMTTGTGPPPAGSYPHTHTLATLTAATMSAPAVSLGYTAEASLFAQRVSSATASYLVAQTAMATADGVSPHVHAFTTFGSGSGLKAAILAAVSMFGVGIDPFAGAFAQGIVDHLVANAAMATGFGPGHVHVLS